MRSVIKVAVEVTEEMTSTNSGRKQQVVYVDTGDKYPVRDTIFVDNDVPRQPGLYIANRLYRDGKKYAFVLDLNNLQPVPAAKKAS